LGSALELVLVKSVESQANTAAKIGQLVTDNVAALAAMQQNAYTRASRKRGGKIRAGSAKRNGGGQFVKGCRLCSDPSTADPTREEIIAHINHRNPGLNYRVEQGAVHMDVTQKEIQTDAQGNEVIECEECAAGVEHTHGRN
jgi:hypothetical protein